MINLFESIILHRNNYLDHFEITSFDYPEYRIMINAALNSYSSFQTRFYFRQVHNSIPIDPIEIINLCRYTREEGMGLDIEGTIIKAKYLFDVFEGIME